MILWDLNWFGKIWKDLKESKVIKQNLKESARIWKNLKESERMWKCLEKSEIIRIPSKENIRKSAKIFRESEKIWVSERFWKSLREFLQSEKSERIWKKFEGIWIPSRVYERVCKNFEWVWENLSGWEILRELVRILCNLRKSERI